MSNELSFWEAVKLRFARGEDVVVKVTHSNTGIAWAGFWIGLGLMLAAAVIKGTLVIR